MTSPQESFTIPEYLQPYVAKQNPALYTPMDHASWRFILKVSQNFLKVHAHQKYLDGLRETGISIEEIPLIDEMNLCLKKFNWQAVAVTGFIPPAVFMEFLSLSILPIACDMRTLDHLAYTPAPDIVHEAAGHAPIIADPEYSDYLRMYGEVSQKAIFSSQDMHVYNAIRYLSDTKENPLSTPQEIDQAQLNLDQAIAGLTYVSEATFLSRMGWWTFEYGLVGDLSRPKIYGAGLFSSIGEGFRCLDSHVSKIPFSIDCIHQGFDITRPQPQLFVAHDFQVLKDALQELAESMAFKRGGVEGLDKAKMAATPTTVMLETGIQASGVLVDYLQSQSGRPCYIQFRGPTQISYRGHQMEGQGADYHRDGYGSPLETVTEDDLQKFGLSLQKEGRMEFESGVSVEGKLIQVLKREGGIVLLSFEACTVKKGDVYLFRPEWGVYDMLCGRQVVSVFGGAADRKNYMQVTGTFQRGSSHEKTNMTEENRDLNRLYADLRQCRNQAQNEIDDSTKKALTAIYQDLEKNYPSDWLLRYELLEMESKHSLGLPWIQSVRTQLNEISKESPEKAEMIQRGFELLGSF